MPEAPLEVTTASGSYPIHVGPGLIHNTEQFAPFIADRSVCVVTDENVAPLYLDKLRQSLASARSIAAIIVPPGEASKSTGSWVQCHQELVAAGLSRDSLLIALGGGVVGDLCGFLAATYMRGVDFLQVPTTLLAQVDSSVGGKTGINLPAGKNLVGAFYQPRAVIIDVDTLQTLPARELAAGVSETIKYGAIMNADFFAWIESLGKELTRDPAHLSHAIRQACAMKADIVAQDEREGSVRALLNFGHTFGHAIEAELAYGEMNHGEAVAVGMCAAAHYSVQKHGLAQAHADRLQDLLQQFDLPVGLDQELSARRLATRMLSDKKNLQGRLRLICLRSLGDAFIDEAGELDMAERSFVHVGAAA